MRRTNPLLLALAMCLLLCACSGKTAIQETAPADTTLPQIADTETTESVEAETEPTSSDSSASVSSGESNALKSAKNYLSVTAFSYSGLVEQLEYEGYSNSEATYAADNCGADWYEQAVKSAKQYLEVMAFSRSGLIEQLEYEGYTHDQAVYGVDKAY